MAKNEYQIIAANSSGSHLIAYNSDLARITNSIESGLLLSQFLYWYKKGNNREWFYKTIAQLKEETYLSRSQQETAIRKCKKLGLIEVKLCGIPRKRYFKLNFEVIIDMLKQAKGGVNFGQTVCSKPTHSSASI